VNSTAQDEITVYVAAVRAALTGLPEATREELLEDLPEHLAEVQAEGNGTLVERLGSPTAYAAELRAAAGFVGGFPDPPSTPRFPQLIEARDEALRVLGQVDVRVGPVLGYPKASDFLILLRPAWWVLRGYLIAMVIASVLGIGRIGLLPRLGDSGLVALVLMAGCIVVSIWLGRQDFTAKRVPRVALRAGSAVLVLVALIGFAGADNSTRSGGPYYNDAGSYDPNPYSNVNDVFVYDSQGNLVPGARLFDQDGSPIQLGNAMCTDETTGETEHSRAMGYPYCPESAPFAPWSPPSPSARASRSAPQTVQPAPDPSLTPTPTRSTSSSPSPSARPS
jgi:hypothetical protein